MSLILSGTDGLSDVDGSAATPAIRGTDANTGIFFPAADTIAFAEGGAECARFDSSGNFGLGVTPTNNTLGKTVQVGQSTVLTADASANRFWLGSNWYYNSGDKYIANGFSTLYSQQSGTHQWFTAASGTAGNAISFTQAMTLTAAGDLSLGNTYSIGGNYLSLAIGGSKRGIIAVRNSAATDMGYMYVNETSGFFTVESAGANPLILSTNGTERARIKSAGEFASASAGDYGIRTAVTAGAGTTTGIFVGARSATAGNTGSGTDTFIVWSNGNVVNTNNSYGAISDIKLKENVIDATPKLDKLNQVRVVNYNLIGDETKQLGVIAQELEQIFPSMIDESPDRDDEGNDLGTTTKSVKYSVFVPMLIKALQEQQALITTLTARITALESA